VKKRLSFLVSIGALTLASCKPQSNSPDSTTSSPRAPKLHEIEAIPADSKTSKVAAKIRKIVAEQLKLSPEAVSLTSTWQQLGADSLDVVELVMAFEEEFQVPIPDEKAEAMTTVGDAASFLASRAKP